MDKRAYAIRHVAFEDLGSLAVALTEAGYRIRYFEAGACDLAPVGADEPELLIVLGGPIGACDEAVYPFLLEELALLRERLARDQATLGVCLGAQLMARALGAAVFTGKAKEIGWAPIELSPAGAATPLRHLVDGASEVLHWHGDSFDLPAGAVHLASSRLYANQAFAWRRRGLALQFHAEVEAQGLERWFIGHAAEIGAVEGVSVNALRQETATHAASLKARSRNFWRAWLQEIA